MGGLLVYLAGPGRRNEHTNPHLVAGDQSVMTTYTGDELDRDSALRIAKVLDQPRRAFDLTFPDGHVFHCPLSLRAEEGQLTDEKWAQIAQEFAERMGFTATDDGRAACRWVAVHHGLSANGNDHIHFVASRAREDGTRWSKHNDRVRAQAICRDLEREHGLQQLNPTGVPRGSRGWHEGERTTAARRGDREIASRTLARTVRACATAATDEADFVRRLRADRLLVRPRYATGRTDVVVGYSVALRPGRGQRPVWYGGGRLAHDLTLPRLRTGWPDSPQHATAAVAEWNAARRNRRTPGSGSPRPGVDSRTWAECTADVAALRERLRTVPPDDHATWARVARDTAGAFAAWSIRVEGAHPGPLARTSDALARSAEVHTRVDRPRPHRAIPAARAAALLLATASGDDGAAVAALMLQLANTAKALHDAHRAVGDARRAQEIATAVRMELARVTAGLPAAAQTLTTTDPEAAAAVQVATRGRRGGGGGSRLPDDTNPTATPPRRATQDPSRDRDIER